MKRSLCTIASLLLLLISPLNAQELKGPCLSCEELLNLKLPDIRITKTETLQEPEPHCKVYGVIGTEINFELLLPAAWNSRFLMQGNGGFAGSMQYNPAFMSGGYALSGTDTGHKGGAVSGDWALNNMERQVNFGHLAVHRTAETSKSIIEKYYCSEPAYSYFWGCSRGGGQAMMEAQRYPGDFDGIVSGAPAFNWSAIGAEFVQNSQAMYPNPDATEAPVVSAANLELLQLKVLEQCDQLDGIQDQILNDPRDCLLDLSQMPMCPGDKPATKCFTSQQFEAIKLAYQGISSDGVQIYPGFPLGGENEPGGWGPWITGPSEWTANIGYPSIQYGFGTEIFKYLIFNDPAWDYSTYDYSNFFKETRYASAYLDATSVDYKAFEERGGKMILWHGWNDPALSAFATIQHFEMAKGQDANLEDYVRLFLLPGVLHCGSGPGPSEVNWLELVREWVENGQAPERVVLSKTEEGEEVMTRPIFPYPKKATYDGIGDPNKEESFN